MHSHIKVVDPGSAAYRARRAANGPQGLWLEGGRIKEKVVRSPGIDRSERLHDVGFAGILKVEAIHQLQVVGGRNADGKATLKACDAGNCPAVCDFARQAVFLGNGKFPHVVENQAIPRVKKRQRVTSPDVQWVKDILEAGSFVKRLAERVRCLE